MTISITIEDQPDTATIEALSNGLDEHNRRAVGPDPTQLIWVVSRDQEGVVVGGLRGVILWTWLLVDWLWVTPSARKQGLGSLLLRTGEQSARDKGCRSAFLNTFSFQAPDFYLKNGYEEFGRLEHFPGDHLRVWMCKRTI